MKRAVGFLAILVLTSLTLSGTAHAHANIVRSGPVNGSAVDESPPFLELEFSEPVITDNAELTIVSPDGTEIDALSASKGASAEIVRFELPALDDGVYRFSWKVVSSTDAHITEGIVILGIGTTPDETALLVETKSNIQPWEVAVRLVLYSALVVAIGAFALAARTHRRRDSSHLAPQIVTIGQRSLITALLAAMALLIGQSIVVSLATNDAPLEAGLSLLSNSWGLWWLVRAAGLLGALAIIRRRGHAGASSPLLAAMLIVAIVGQAASGHMAATADALIGVTSATLHLLGVGLWVGSVVTFGLLLRRHGGTSVLPRPLMQSFSQQALFGAGLTFATGLYAMGINVASIDALLFSTYGRMLTAKLVVVAAVVGLGAANFRRFRSDDQTWPQRLVSRESMLGVGVLLLAAAITATPTATGPFWDAPVIASESLRGTVANDVQVGIEIAPGRAGENFVRVQAASRRRPAPAPIGRVIFAGHSRKDDQSVRVELPETSPAVFEASAVLPVGGEWDFDVIVRRPGVPDEVAAFDWAIPTVARDPDISNARLDRWTTPASAGLGALGAILVMSALVRRGRQRREGRELDAFLLGAASSTTPSNTTRERT